MDGTLGRPSTASAYGGTGTTYAVEDGVAVVENGAPLRGAAAGDPLLRADPATCG